MRIILAFAALLVTSAASSTAFAYCLPEDYLRQRPDVQAAGMDPRDHFLNYGQSEGMCEPWSNGCANEEYLKRRPDVAAAGLSPETHYQNWGRFEGMCRPFGIPQNQTQISQQSTASVPQVLGGQACSDELYLIRRPDVAAANMTAGDHYRLFGKTEGMCKPSSAAKAESAAPQYACMTTVLQGRTFDLATYPGNPYKRGLNRGEYFYSNSVVVYCQ